MRTEGFDATLAEAIPRSTGEQNCPPTWRVYGCGCVKKDAMVPEPGSPCPTRPRGTTGETSRTPRRETRTSSGTAAELPPPPRNKEPRTWTAPPGPQARPSRGRNRPHVPEDRLPTTGKVPDR